MSLLKKINRIKVHRTARHGRFWCGSCDRAHLGVGQKYPICGNGEKRVDKS
jgi:hypothetical protein